MQTIESTKPLEPAGVTFAERMGGFVGLGQQTFHSGYARGRSKGTTLVLRLTVAIPDIDAFLRSPDHPANIQGSIDNAVGAPMPINRGVLKILTVSRGDINRKTMNYRLHFLNEKGDPYTLTGTKDVHDDIGFDVWKDTTTLFVNILSGHVPEGADATAEIVAAGILRLTLRDLIKQLATMRGTGATMRLRLSALSRFARFFAKSLWNIYMSFELRRHVLKFEREIPLHTTEGVPDADCSVHPFTTEDMVGLSLLRFKRGKPSTDIVMIIHGLTTSSDMFIMPEHRNLVTYLMENGFQDVWTLDYRMSNRFPYNLTRHRYTMDDIALYDYPAALRTIRAAVGPDVRIHVVSHCLGAVSFSMSLFAGAATDVQSVVANSASLTPRVPRWSRVKGRIAPFLTEYVLNFPYLDPMWNESPGVTLGKVFAKVVSAFHRECNVPACHMLSLMWGTGWPALYSHRNLDERTHRRSGDLYGGTSIHYHRHVFKMVSAGQAVKYDRQNSAHSSLPDDYFKYAQSIKTPMLLLTGQDNRVFQDSNVVCFERLEALAPGLHRLKVIPGYGHQDIFMGQRCDRDVFPHILNFLNQHRTLPREQPLVKAA